MHTHSNLSIDHYEVLDLSHHHNIILKQNAKPDIVNKSQFGYKKKGGRKKEKNDANVFDE